MLFWLLEIKTAFCLSSTMFKMLAWIVAAIWYLIFLIPQGPPLFCHQLCTQRQKKKKGSVNPNKPKQLRQGTLSMSARTLLPSPAISTKDRELSLVTTVAKILSKLCSRRCSSHLIVTMALWVIHDHFSNFIEEGTDTQEGGVMWSACQTFNQGV